MKRPSHPADTVGGVSCCVCGLDDARALVDVALPGGATAVLCGTHALMNTRAGGAARSEADLRAVLRERRERADRRRPGDELGDALASAFAADRRGPERRRTGAL